MVDIPRSFETSSMTVSNFFQRPDVGFYIPLYQREYSWNKENIDQLMEDICQGVDVLTVQEGENIIRFLGTIILVKELNRDINIDPIDKRALPKYIDNVIDGQQRISTIALLACLLYQKLYKLKEQLPKTIKQQGIEEAVDTYLATLIEVFSFDLRRGSPARKPIIIRGSVDGWTFDGDDNNYQSDVSSFIASFIRAIQGKEDKVQFPKIPTGGRVASNIGRMNYLLKKVEDAHKNELSEDVDFPSARKILKKISQVDLWSYERPELVNMVEENGSQKSQDKNQNTVCSLIQYFAFCYYLLQRCCLTLIEPESDDRAFDMFQSLNATGTNLTAIETFKPLVVNSVNSNNGSFNGSKSEAYFAQIDKLLNPLKKSSKDKITNEYLSIFGATYNGGKKPTRQFSAQRKWLIDEYDKCKSIEQKEEFIRQMSDLATWMREIEDFDQNKLPTIPKIEEVQYPDRKQAEVCILYLREAGHKMANTILSRFYSLIIRNERVEAAREFVFACKAVAAFFTLWRSASDNKELDDAYRKLLRDQMSWENGNEGLTVAELKKNFLKVLEKKEIGNQEKWQKKARENLTYERAKTVCKFAIFVTSDNTIPDPNESGLMIIGTEGSTASYLEAMNWRANDLKSLEHIAPKDRLSDIEWDENLYEDDVYDRIGNLTLLPTDINSSASNKSWVEKWRCYRYLAETTPNRSHIIPIVQLGAEGVWDKQLVDKRTDRICDILWNRIYKWLN